MYFLIFSAHVFFSRTLLLPYAEEQLSLSEASEETALPLLQDSRKNKSSHKT